MRRFALLLLLASASAGLAFSQRPANCPTISVAGPAGIVQTGEKFIFHGSVEGDAPNNLSFQWEVSGGKITNGQGTLEISAEADWNAGGTTIIATLKVMGLPEGCPGSASETSIICLHPVPILIDEFGRMSNTAIKARLDKFFIELVNNPSDQGYIILYGTNKEIEARERLVVNSVNFRHFDGPRITIVRAGIHSSGKVHTKLYRVPLGADNPAP